MVFDTEQVTFVLNAVRRYCRQPSPANLSPLSDLGIVSLPGGRNNQLFSWQSPTFHFCIKLYKQDNRQRADHEWQSLCLLYAQNLTISPRPVYYQQEPQPPIIVMDFLAGEPLNILDYPGLPHLSGLADMLQQLYSRLTPALVSYPYSVAGSPAVLQQRLEVGLAQMQLQPQPLAKLGAKLLRQWLDSDDSHILARPAPLVFSPGDSNLANRLWDGSQVRCLDFEYAGWSDVAFDLADTVEHLNSRRINDTEWANFVARFNLDCTQQQRFKAACRLLGVFWVMLLWQRQQSEEISDVWEAQIRRASSLLQS